MSYLDLQGTQTNKTFMSPFLNTSLYNKKGISNNGEKLQTQKSLDEEGRFKNSQKQQNKNNKDIITLEKNGESSKKLSKQENTPDFTKNIEDQENSRVSLNNNNNIFNQQQTLNLNNQLIPSNTNVIAQQSNNSSVPSLAFGSNQKKQKTCNCKKTKCLKLYCDCFAAGELCGGECNCFGCFNTSNSEKRAGAIVSIMDRQPDAFGPKIEQNSHKKGCNCARSGCQKKYCECYTLGIACGEYCKCTQCKNTIDSIDKHTNGLNVNAHSPLQDSKKVSIEKRKQTFDQIEQQSSSKKKVFLSSTSQHSVAHKIKNISQFNDGQETGNELFGEEQLNSASNNYYQMNLSNKQYNALITGNFKEQKKHNHNEEDSLDIEEEEQISASQKIFTTPLKQTKNDIERNFTTADTAKKQKYQLQDNDSDIKNRIVKLQISENQSSQKKSFQKLNKLVPNVQNDSIQSNGSDEDNQISKNPEEIKITYKKITIIPQLSDISTKK